jgi:rhodanese-related sulfurtransferase
MPPESTHGFSTAEVSSAIPVAKKDSSQYGPRSSLDMSRPEEPQPCAANSSSNNNNSHRDRQRQRNDNNRQQTAMFMLSLPPCSRAPPSGKGLCPAASPTVVACKRASSPATTKDTIGGEIGSLSPTELVKRLDGGPRAVVLVDCRSFLTFNKRHIEGAVSINCTNCFTKRRLQQGKLTLNDLATTDEGREVLVARNDKDVVVYDEDTRQAEDLPSNHPTLLVLNSLRNEGSRASLLTGQLQNINRPCSLTLS